MGLEMRNIWGDYYGLTASERLVALFIYEYCSTVAPLNPSFEEISKFTGLAETTVKRCLILLFEKTFLSLCPVMMDDEENKYGKDK